MAYVKKLKLGDQTYDIVDSRIITIVDSGSTTEGTWKASTEAPAGNLTKYTDGQLFLYKVAVAGASTTTLNIDGLGAKTVYRVGTTKLSTQYGVGQYLLLAYNSTNDCFRVVNDSDANSYAYVRQYQHGANAAGTAGKYPLLARYNVTNKNGTYDTAYARYHTGAYVDTSTGEIYSEGSKVLTEDNSTAAAVTTINGGSGSFTPTTKYLHKSTASVAPNSHTHNVTVSGTTGSNSGNAVKAVTGYASFSGGSGSGSLSVYSSDTTTTADTAASSGRVPYISSASHTAASLGTASTGTVSISGGSYSGTTKYMKVSTTAADTGTVGISGGSGSLVAYDASTGGNAKTTNGNRIPFITSLSKGGYTPAGSVTLTDGTAPSLGTATTKYLHFSAGTTPKSGATPNTTSTNSGSAGGGTANQTTGSTTPTFTGSEVTSGGSTVLTAASVSNGVLTITSASHTHKVTAAGTVGAHTHTYTKPAAHTHTYDKTTSISLTDGTAPSLTANTTSTNGIKYIEAQGTFSAGTTPKKSASFTGTNSTAVVTGGTTYYLAHGHTGASLTGITTFNTNAIKAVALSASTTSTDGPAYTESISGSAPSLGGTKTFVTGYPNFSGGSGSHTTKYLKLNHTHTGASLGAATTADVSPNGHTHSYGDSTALTSTTNSGTAVTVITGLTANTTSASGDITYLESATHSHTGASVSGTASVYKKED